MGDRHSLLAAAMVLLVGFSTALWIYVTAAPEPGDSAAAEVTETKQYQRQIELYGGKANVLATELLGWLRSLWRGRRLALTVACLTVLVAGAFWLFAAASRDGGRSG